MITGAAAFHEADIDLTVKGFLVIERRFVEIDKLNELNDSFVYIEEGHVTTEAATEAASGEFWFRHAWFLFRFPGLYLTADRLLIEEPFALGNEKAGALNHNAAYRADTRGFVRCLEIGVVQAAFGIDREKCVDATAFKTENRFSILGSRGANTT